MVADRNPNTAGARLAGIAPGKGGFGLDGFRAAAEAGKVKWAVLVGEDLDDRPEDLAALAKVPFVAVIGSREGPTAAKAGLVLAGATWAEKDGTFVNVDGRMQRLRACVRPPGEARTESRILLDLLARIAPAGSPAADSSPAALFRAMAEELPGLAGLTLAKLGDRGVALPGAATARREVEV
jgi:NADH-quinone oxidoreductase subunit G